MGAKWGQSVESVGVGLSFMGDAVIRHRDTHRVRGSFPGSEGCGSFASAAFVRRPTREWGSQVVR